MILIYGTATVSNNIYCDEKESLKKEKHYLWADALKQKKEIADTHFWPDMATELEKA